MQNPTKTVLVIEDERELGHALTARLEHQGYRTVTSTDGLSGLIKSRYLEPDLLLLDLNLPRCNGFELLRSLRKTPGLQELPVVVMTGSSDPTVEAQAREFDVKAVLHKPFATETLMAAVAAALAA